MNDKSKGGQRKGVGRPRVALKRKQRTLHYYDEEWELIRQKAAFNNMSPREYLFNLVEKDK